MSVHTTYRCDACPVPVAGEVERDHSVRLHLGREMDGAGSMENVGETVHLCHACCIAILGALTKVPHRLADTPFGEIHNDLFIKWIRTRRKS